MIWCASRSGSSSLGWGRLGLPRADAGIDRTDVFDKLDRRAAGELRILHHAHYHLNAFVCIR